MRQTVPSVNITGSEIRTQNDCIVVENIMEDLCQSESCLIRHKQPRVGLAATCLFLLTEELYIILIFGLETNAIQHVKVVSPITTLVRMSNLRLPTPVFCGAIPL